MKKERRQWISISMISFGPVLNISATARHETPQRSVLSASDALCDLNLGMSARPTVQTVQYALQCNSTYGSIACIIRFHRVLA